MSITFDIACKITDPKTDPSMNTGLRYLDITFYLY